ncbi:hypothetical protein PV326_000703 [Microctonus aethiopoides]|nr:hypothetical protein PV326_000703 [Microctonus aethiopoides]
MHGATFPATNSSVLDKYLTFKNKEKNQKKNDLIFPNLPPGTLKLSRRRVHKQNIIKDNRMKKNDIKLNNQSTGLLFLNKNNNDETKANVVDYNDNCDTNNAPVEMKYSWQDLAHWIPPSEKKKIDEGRQNFYINDKQKDIECKIKYSWQIVGLSSQTSNTFIAENNLTDDSNNYNCCIKYSWQIIGTGTQASLHDINTEKLQDDYWNGKILIPNQCKYIPNIFDNNRKNVGNLSGYNKNKNCILYCEITQTTADKCFQTELTDCRMQKHIFKRLLNADLTNTNVEIPILEIHEQSEVLDNTLTDETIPLTDDSNQSFDAVPKYIERDEKKIELMNRVALVRKKIQSYERVSDAERLPPRYFELINDDNYQHQHNSMNTPSDFKSFRHAHENYKKIEKQLQDLRIAENQIIHTTKRVLKEIDCTYDRLAKQVIREINHKRDLMKLEAVVFHNESIAPLKACRKELRTLQFNEEKTMFHLEDFSKDSTKQDVSNRDIEKILNANCNIEGLPAVPLTEELPYLAFKPPTNSSFIDFLNKVDDFGSILYSAPIEIINIEEKPASFFVKWAITNPEFDGEEQIYVLQKAKGEVIDPTSDNFETVYKGPETCAFVRDILVDESITLRVGIQSLESAWSQPRIVKTKIPNYRWSNNNKNYIIENQTARKISDNTSTLFSHEPQIDSNQIIEFKFLEASESENNDAGIALVVDPKGDDDNLRRDGVLMISSNGKIFMDGDEKLMQLPQIKLGTKIIFTIMRKRDEYLRINIECDDKAVTYDWSVETPLYFAARFSGNNKWHLMVK